MSNYTKEQIEERISFYTEKLERSKIKNLNNLHNISVYENLLKFWINQKPNEK